MIDLHTHTTYSDGTKTPKELLIEAEEMGMKIISITDHDTIDAYDDLKDGIDKELFSGQIVYGIEISTTYKNEPIEILAYDFNLETFKKDYGKILMTVEESYHQRFDLIKNKMDELKITYNENNLIRDYQKSKIKSPLNVFYFEIIKYEENIKRFPFLLEDRRVFARQHINNPNSNFYVNMNEFYPSLKEVISLIKKHGGKSFLAHLYSYSSNVIDSKEDLILNNALDGAETYYPTFKKEQTKELIELLDSNNKLKSGGTDYHGTNKIQSLGTGINNNMNIDQRSIEKWLKINNDKPKSNSKIPGF